MSFRVTINRHFPLNEPESAQFVYQAKTAIDAATVANMAQVAAFGSILVESNAARLRGFSRGQTWSMNDGARSLFVTIERE